MTKKTISIKSRKAKARVLQNYIAEKISEITGIPWGKDELVAPREMGQKGNDVRLIGKALTVFPWSVEAKNSETWALPSAIKQVKQNMYEQTNWLVFLKKNHHEPIVVMDAEVFFNLYKKIIEGEYFLDPDDWYFKEEK